MHIEDVSDRKRLEAELSHRALHDPLTGLANRTLLAERLREVARPPRPPHPGWGTCSTSTSTGSRR